MKCSKQTQGRRENALQLVAYQCPSCNLLTWHHHQSTGEACCPFCSHVLPAYVTKVSPERMVMTGKPNQLKSEAAQEDSMSPFVLEFFMVQGTGFRCMAYRNGEGRWRGAFDNEELPGEVRVLG
jgi:hypothetical protein